MSGRSSHLRDYIRVYDFIRVYILPTYTRIWLSYTRILWFYTRILLK